MKGNLFDNAKFGDMFLTTENKQAVFLRFAENAEYKFAILYIEGWGNVQVFRHNGNEIYNDAAHSIISKQDEPVKRTPADIEAAMQEVEDKSKAFTQAHKGESADNILAQMRGEAPDVPQPKRGLMDFERKIAEILFSETSTNELQVERVLDVAIAIGEGLMKDAVEATCLMLPYPDLFKVLSCYNITDKLKHSDKIKLVPIKEE